MRLSAIAAGLFLFTIFFVTNSSPIQAKEASNTNIVKNVLSGSGIELQKPVNQTLAISKPEVKTPEPPKPVEHTVVTGETLSKIAATHGSSWQRLYSKNLQISNPDVINADSKIIIPLTEEVLPERALPVAPVPPPASPATTEQATVYNSSVKPSTKAKTKATPASPRKVSTRAPAGGNTYAAGYCTFYAKQRRGDLPNNLGNANTWVARAAAQGIATGSVPRVGAIGQQGMHVVYVEAVNGDGTIRVSEMNYAGLGVVSSRNASAGSFQYIY